MLVKYKILGICSMELSFLLIMAWDCLTYQMCRFHVDLKKIVHLVKLFLYYLPNKRTVEREKGWTIIIFFVLSPRILMHMNRVVCHTVSQTRKRSWSVQGGTSLKSWFLAVRYLSIALSMELTKINTFLMIFSLSWSWLSGPRLYFNSLQKFLVCSATVYEQFNYMPDTVMMRKTKFRYYGAQDALGVWVEQRTIVNISIGKFFSTIQWLIGTLSL